MDEHRCSTAPVIGVAELRAVDCLRLICGYRAASAAACRRPRNGFLIPVWLNFGSVTGRWSIAVAIILF